MKRLVSAIRQYKHNDGSDGFVTAYDKEETEKAFVKLESDIKVRTLINLRDSIQPDGLINSDAGTKTILAITNSINKIINDELTNK
tara:strand:- start:960 stop:1217 length:258 start_codon:yes stop_codon:yes gene_type:complete